MFKKIIGFEIYLRYFLNRLKFYNDLGNFSKIEFRENNHRQFIFCESYSTG